MRRERFAVTTEFHERLTDHVLEYRALVLVRFSSSKMKCLSRTWWQEGRSGREGVSDGGSEEMSAGLSEAGRE